AFDAPSTDMSRGSQPRSRTMAPTWVRRGQQRPAGGSGWGPMKPMRALGSRAPLDRTQVVPSSLYSIYMFSSHDSGSQGVTVKAIPAPVVVAMTTRDSGTVLLKAV
ncbi:Protein STU1, partial [Frankliniella fusca]